MPCSMRLWPQIWRANRAYSSGPREKPSRLRNTISLDHFIQRGRALALWRTIVRDCRRISDENTRKETLQFARDEFERNRNVTDISHIRYLISTGKTQWDTMERYIDGL
ncbi:hypothetical protein F5884DRAFT_221018 [Xylogone sp. PMI_703]|nr:hypothetical protein F5884DRAFT_221018 [Xylogone sp. PMI_703]